MSMPWGDAAAWAGVVVSLVMSGAALWVSLRGQRKAERIGREANAEARRSADASERSAAAAERASAMAEQEAARYRPPWVLQRVTKDKYTLTNDSDEEALDVKVEADGLMGDKPNHPSIGPGSAISFYAVELFQQDGDQVTVTWRRPGETEQRTWKDVLR